MVVVAPLANHSGAGAAVGTVYEREAIAYRSVRLPGAGGRPGLRARRLAGAGGDRGRPRRLRAAARHGGLRHQPRRQRGTVGPPLGHRRRRPHRRPARPAGPGRVHALRRARGPLGDGGRAGRDLAPRAVRRRRRGRCSTSTCPRSPGRAAGRAARPDQHGRARQGGGGHACSRPAGRREGRAARGGRGPPDPGRRRPLPGRRRGTRTPRTTARSSPPGSPRSPPSPACGRTPGRTPTTWSGQRWPTWSRAPGEPARRPGGRPAPGGPCPAGPPGGGSALVPGPVAPVPLDLRPPSLLLEAPLPEPRVGRVGRRGCSAQRGGEPGGQALEGQLAVAGLGALVGGGGPHHRTEALEQPGALAGAEGGGPPTSKRTSTRLLVRLACWPPGPPGVVARHADLRAGGWRATRLTRSAVLAGHAGSRRHRRRRVRRHRAARRLPRYAPAHGIPTPRAQRHGRLGPLLRQLDHPRRPGGGGRGQGLRGAPPWTPGITTFDTADVYALGRGRGGAGPGAQGRAARVDRDLHQGLLAHRAQPQQPRPVAQAHHRVAATPRSTGCRPTTSTCSRPTATTSRRRSRRRSGPSTTWCARARSTTSGVSEWTADQIAEALRIADEMGFDRIVSNQPQYSLLWRVIEAEVVPALREGGHRPDRLVAPRPGRAHRQVPAGRPAARRLPGHRRAGGAESITWLLRDEVLEPVQRFAALAREAGHTPATVALAWVLENQNVVGRHRRAPPGPSRWSRT